MIGKEKILIGFGTNDVKADKTSDNVKKAKRAIKHIHPYGIDAPVWQSDIDIKALMKIVKSHDVLVEALNECRLALEPYDDIKPRDWITDRQRIKVAHEMAKKALKKAGIK